MEGSSTYSIVYSMSYKLLGQDNVFSQWPHQIKAERLFRNPTMTTNVPVLVEELRACFRADISTRSYYLDEL